MVRQDMVSWGKPRVSVYMGVHMDQGDIRVPTLKKSGESKKIPHSIRETYIDGDNATWLSKKYKWTCKKSYGEE